MHNVHLQKEHCPSSELQRYPHLSNKYVQADYYNACHLSLKVKLMQLLMLVYEANLALAACKSASENDLVEKALCGGDNTSIGDFPPGCNGGKQGS